MSHHAAILRDAIASAPTRQARLALVPIVWKGALEGALAEDEADELARLASGEGGDGPATPHRRPLVRVVRRPSLRSPDREKSIQRRRATAMSGAVPAKIAAGFTVGETAVLAVIARQVQRLRGCTLPIDAVAAMAGVCRRLAQRALRKAEAAGLIRIVERRQRAFKHLPHRIEVVSAEWRTWLRLKGCKKLHPTDKQHISSSDQTSGSMTKRPAKPAEGLRKENGGTRGRLPPRSNQN